MTLSYSGLLDRWNSNKGKPYKGKLIDLDAHTKNPKDPGCMCAQGQVLHELGGWTPHQLYTANQRVADRATAKLLNISLTHSIVLRNINDAKDGAPAIVLTDPGKVLGDQWSKILDFWSYIDVRGRSEATASAAWVAASALKAAALKAAALKAASLKAATATEAATWAAAAAEAEAWVTAAWVTAATWEIQGAEILRRDGKPFFFLPMFGFASPDDIPTRPANYGVPSIGSELAG